MSASPKREHVGRRLKERYRRLEEARRKRPAAAILARFNEIDGGTQSGLVSIELFTTVIPLIILGFGYFSGFAKDASPGILLIRELGLQHPLSDNPASTWTQCSFVNDAFSLTTCCQDGSSSACNQPCAAVIAAGERIEILGRRPIDGVAAHFLEAGELFRRRRVVLTQLGKDARPQLGRVAIQVVPATAGHGRE